MKTKHGVFFGFAVILAAAIFTLVGCDNSAGGGSGGGDVSTSGRLTITGIPSEYNGSYIVATDASGNDLIAVDSVNMDEQTLYAVKISNGTATLKVYRATGNGSIESYNGAAL
ncbi:MAG: hypothetical protein LBF80_05980 [Spirochaetaceae bacterium]|jgi:uncharacterized lipoprotein NlpE involved in copper resistance|nr:hypothetical protein [Spirochaetaceae bacterium]